MYKIIIFDFDGTIADTNKCIIETFQQSLVELGFDTMEEENISRLIGLVICNFAAPKNGKVDAPVQKMYFHHH